MSLPVASCAVGGGIKKNALLLDRARYFALFLLWFVFIGLRGFIYVDWLSYYPFYNELPSLLDGGAAVARCLEKATFEKGYVLYSILLKTVSGNYFFFTCVSSSIDFIIMFWAFKRYAPGQAVLCFAFFWIFDGLVLTCSALRNVKSIMLFLISLKYAQERRIVPYFALNILGFFFHLSAIVYLPLYFVITRRFSFSFYVLLFAAGNIIYLFQIKWILPILGFFAGLLTGMPIGNKIVGYMNNSNYNFGYGISIGYIERFFTYILVLHFLRRLCEEDKSNIVFVNLMFVCILAQLYLTEMNILFDRISWLVVPSYWILYPKIYSMLKKDYKWLFVAVLAAYGLLKLAQTNGFVNLYDNVLWQQFSFEERAPLVRAYIRLIRSRF